MTNYLLKTVEEIHELLKKKEIKPIDLVEECFARIEANKDLNAFITLNKEEAIKKAKELEELEVDNLFFGIPIAIKDNICTEGLRTTCASKMLENFEPIYDAEVIKKINDKNMIIIILIHDSLVEDRYKVPFHGNSCTYPLHHQFRKE